MKRIASFDIDHTKLFPGLYVSRKDVFGDEVITTFDIRVCTPNTEHVLKTGEIHTTEHIIATYLRNDARLADKVVYFGPMGCRTGYYFILAGDYSSEDILESVRDSFKFVADFEGDIPGATEVECGNYRDMDLDSAKQSAREYYNLLVNITPDRLVYPQ